MADDDRPRGQCYVAGDEGRVEGDAGDDPRKREGENEKERDRLAPEKPEAGDAESGVTVMQMEAGLDTGPMLLKVSTPISAEDTGGSLHDRLAELGPQAVVEAIAGLAAGTLKGEVQDDALATYAHKLNKDEARLDWSRPAVELERLVRAFNPWPICHCTLNGEPLKVLAARLGEGTGAALAFGIIKAAVACHTGMATFAEAKVAGRGED